MSDQPELDAPPPEQQSRRRVPWLVALLGASVLGNIALYYWVRPQVTTDTNARPVAEADSRATVEMSAEAQKRAGIETGEALTQVWTESIEARGRLVVNEDSAALVGSFVEGRVTRVEAMVGDQVREGQPLVYIHSHEVAQARSDYARARAAIVRAERNLAQAKSDLDRATRLLDAKAISAREKEHAATNVVAINAELEQARAEEHRAVEFLHHLGASPTGEDDAVVRSPQAGTILKRSITPGTVVTPATELFVVARLSTLWAILEVPEAQARAVAAGQTIALKVAAFPDVPFHGRVIRLGETLNPTTRMFEIRCLVENANRRLRPEMYATARIAVASGESVIALPRDAIQEMKQEQVVFVRLGDGKFEKRRVVTGREKDGLLEIREGIEVGTIVVTRGAFFVKSEFLKGSLSDE